MSKPTIEELAHIVTHVIRHSDDVDEIALELVALIRAVVEEMRPERLTDRTMDDIHDRLIEMGIKKP